MYIENSSSVTTANPWYEQVEFPVPYRDMTREAQVAYLRSLAPMAIQAAAEDEAGQPEKQRPLVRHLGHQAVNGTGNLMQGVGAGAEDVVLRVLAVR